MYIKYIVNYWSVCLYHDIHSKATVIYFEQGLVERGGFVAGEGGRMGDCMYPVLAKPSRADSESVCFVRTQEPIKDRSQV